MANPSNPTAVAVLERDTNGDILWGWIYPTLSNELRSTISAKTGLKDLEGLGTRSSPRKVFGKYKSTWFYIYTTSIEALPAAEVPDASALACVVCSEQFNPELYFDIAGVMVGHYANGGSGTQLMQAYLSLYTSGSCKSLEGDVLKLDKYSIRKSYARGSLKAIIRKFGVESILIYIAILLKKRVVVVCPDVEELVGIMRALPQFVYHRQNWNILRPCVDMTELEITALEQADDAYVAGFTDESITIREDLYDLVVDVAGASITVSTHAGNVFGMGKIHKEIAMSLTTQADDEATSDEDLLRDLVDRTQTLLDGLGKLAKPSTKDANRQVVTLDDIKARKMPASMHKFLYNLALAEDMVEK
eukprot:m.139141 g.139141  ORF g.139141 m.139141 type:complete len:361 (-) comp30039_c0_seq1:102-1184(-)